jgi:Phospholipase_D-nuclease N-terminal
LRAFFAWATARESGEARIRGQLILVNSNHPRSRLAKFPSLTGLERTIGDMLGGLFFLVFVVGGTIFWVLMIIKCATKESSQGNNKLIWILIIIFTHWIGALVYYLVRRPQRIAELGA